ncbi:hypothetical protein P4S73_28895 [Paraglaciecola sp. Hal342]
MTFGHSLSYSNLTASIHDDWANILAVFSEQQAPSMSEMKLRCEELLADGVISLKKPRQNQNVEKRIKIFGKN